MQFNQAILDLPQYPFAALAATRKRLIDSGVKVYDFSKGDPTEPTPEFIRKALSGSIPAISQYPAVKGLPELRSTISEYCKKRFQVSLDPEKELIHCNGTKEAIYHLPQLVVGTGSKKNLIIATTPGFMVIERAARAHGAEFYGASISESNNYLLELSELPKEILNRAAMLLLNYPNNPTGARCDLEYLKRQVKTAQHYGILLCSDECYVELYLDDQPAPSILQVTKEGVLALQSCSKRSGMTGYRSGFIAGDQTVIKHYLTLRDAIGTETPVFIQNAAQAAWHDEAHVAGRREIFSAKRAVLTQFFRERGIEYLDSNATFYLWITPPRGLTGKEYAELLLQGGVMVTPGEFFGQGAEKRVRVALVPSVEQCVEAIAIWKRIDP